MDICYQKTDSEILQLFNNEHLQNKEIWPELKYGSKGIIETEKLLPKTKLHMCNYIKCRQYIDNFRSFNTKIQNQKKRVKLIEKLTFGIPSTLNQNVISFPKKVAKYVEALEVYKSNILKFKYKPDAITMNPGIENLTKIHHLANTIQINEIAFKKEIMIAEIHKVYKPTDVTLQDIPLNVENIDKGLFMIFARSYEMMLNFFVHILLRKTVLYTHAEAIKPVVVYEKSELKTKINQIITAINDIRLFYIKHLNERNAITEFINKNKSAISLLPSYIKVYKNLNELLSFKHSKSWPESKQTIFNNAGDLAALPPNIGELLVILGYKKQTPITETYNITVLKHFDENNQLLSAFYPEAIEIDINKIDPDAEIPTIDLSSFNQTEYNKLLTLYEKLSGAVRVIVVPRTFDILQSPLCKKQNLENINFNVNFNVLKNNASTDTKICIYENKKFAISDTSVKLQDTFTKESKTYGPFYSVAQYRSKEDILKNSEEIAKTNLRVDSICEYLSNGPDNNLYLFTYGYSGAGKTTSLIGTDTDDGGVLKDFYDVFQSKNVDLTLRNIYLLYGKMKNDSTFNESKPKLIEENLNINNFKDFKNKFKTIMNMSPTNNLPEFIKSTPNNKQSSRGFLFFEFVIKSETNTNKMCIVDMAGNENPYDIMIKTLPTFKIPTSALTVDPKTNKPTTPKHFLNSRNIQDKDFVYELVAEQIQTITKSITDNLSSMASFILNDNLARNFHLHYANLTDFIEFYMFNKKTDHEFSNEYKTLSKKIFTKQYSAFRTSLIEKGRIESFDVETIMQKFRKNTQMNAMFINKCKEMNYIILSSYAKCIPQILKLLIENNKKGINGKLFWTEDSGKKHEIKTTDSINIKKTLISPLNIINKSLEKIGSKPIANATKKNNNQKLIELYCDQCVEALQITLSKQYKGPYFNFVEAEDKAQFVINPNADMLTFLSFYFCNKHLIPHLNQLPENLEKAYTEIYQIIFYNETKDVERLKVLSIYVYLETTFAQYSDIENATSTTDHKPFVIREISPNVNKANEIDPANPLKLSETKLNEYFNSRLTTVIKDDNELLVKESAYFEDIIREGFYINQVNNELVNKILKTEDKTKQQSKTFSPADLYIDKYTSFTSLPSETGLNKLISEITPHRENNLYVMLAALRTEEDIKYRLGAIQTLEYVDKLKST